MRLIESIRCRYHRARAIRAAVHRADPIYRDALRLAQGRRPWR